MPIPRTHRNDWPDVVYVEAAPLHDVLMTAWLRPAQGGTLDRAAAAGIGSTAVPARTYRNRAELQRATSFDPQDLALLIDYCARFGIEIVATHWRSVTIRGQIDQLTQAFGAKVDIRERPGTGARFRHRSGSLHVPHEIAAILEGVFGLHPWPPSPRFRVPDRAVRVTALSADAIAQRYGFPDNDGAGQTIGILQLGGHFVLDDFEQCMKLQGVRAHAPVIHAVDQTLERGIHETVHDFETALDVQIAAALAPGARLAMYDAPNTERGLLDAVRDAIFTEEDAPTILSISYGWPEMLWTPAALHIADELFVAAALLGVTIVCASGDNGDSSSLDGTPRVLAPASSPFVLACGATQIEKDDSESVWDERPQPPLNSGGGFSAYEGFARPDWQRARTSHHREPGRGVPDVAAQTEPGYIAFVDGKPLNAIGTSAVAPTWAALTARLNASLGATAGFYVPLLYAEYGTPLFRDVLKGDNGAYHAAAGWNPCTGLGVPDGMEILRALRGEGLTS